MADSGASRTLHIVNGDSVRMTLEAAAVPGDISVQADALHEGPVPAGMSGEDMRRVRAQALAGGDAERFSEILESLRKADRELEDSARYDEVVLWFEHDLFDQLLLIRLLDWYSGSARPSRLSLICIGEFPGVVPFKGLGQLRPDQLAPLMDIRRTVDADEMELAVRAWHAFRSETPRELQDLVGGDTRALPFLGDSLRRLLEEYPSSRTGLPRTEREILTILRDGPMLLRELFQAEHARETSYYMGDLTFRDRLQQLAAGPAPLIEVPSSVFEAEPPLNTGGASITNRGREVLEGHADWLADGDFNRWIGGVHIHRGSMWRRDELTGEVSPA